GTFAGVDCHWSQDIFTTCGGGGGGGGGRGGGGGGGGVVEVWSELRSTPLRSYSWGSDSVTCVRFNPVETDILASCASDRNIVLYDLRSPTPLKKVIMAMRSNSVAWNPMVPSSFTVANEDHSLYSWDMRDLTCATCVHTGHVGAVLDVNFCPTGTRFVSASFDRTLREFNAGQGHSCEVYHAKRMQRVVAVRWSLDSKFLLAPRDEMNIRVWKADASHKLGVISPRERAAMDYGSCLRERFASFPAVKRIARHRHLPQTLHSATREARVMLEARRKRERNLRHHSRPDSIPHLPERKKHIVATVD
ncbi:LOW QUALITY PROTEIN: DDB1- and CUL4-associated factor 13-like, partial [Lampetra fluviatilis]